jgi:hypothetical protein
MPDLLPRARVARTYDLSTAPQNGQCLAPPGWTGCPCPSDLSDVGGRQGLSLGGWTDSTGRCVASQSARRSRDAFVADTLDAIGLAQARGIVEVGGGL